MSGTELMTAGQFRRRVSDNGGQIPKRNAKWKDRTVAAIFAAIAGFAGGAPGAYVATQVLDSRVANVEEAVREARADRKMFLQAISEIRGELRASGATRAR